MLVINVQGMRPEEQTRNLLEWLNDAALPNVNFEQKKEPPKAWEMGAELLPCIIAVLEASSPVILEIIRSVNGWIEATRSDAEIEIRIDGKCHLQLKLSNVKNVDEIIEGVLAKLPISRG